MKPTPKLPKTPRRRTWRAAAAPAWWWWLPLLGGCDRAAEPATPAPTEASAAAADSVVASQFEKDGKLVHTPDPMVAGKPGSAPAQAPLGRPAVVQRGGAQVEASEVGLPFYPGAQVMVRENQRVHTPEQRTVVVVLETSEPAELVAKFYRDQLRALAGKGRMVDNSNGKEVMFLLLANEKSEPSLTVHIDSPTASTRRIQLTSSVRFTR